MSAATVERGTRTRSLLAILAAILPVTITGTPITVQPGMVQGMVDYMHLGDVQAGFVASAEVSGLMAATVIFAFIGSKLSWHKAYIWGMLIVIAGNLLSLVVGAGPAFTATRAITGIGAGLVTAIGFAALGETRDAPRNYGWAVASIIGYSAIALWVLPFLFAIGGYGALVISYAIAVVLCLPLVSCLPQRLPVQDRQGSMTAEDVALLSPTGILAISSVLLFFIGYAAAWTYMALIGRDAGLNESSVSHILSISQFAGVIGALSIVILSRRFSDLLQAAIILIIGAIGIFAFVLPQEDGLFLGLNCLFQFTWNAGQPLLLGIIASRDAFGRLLRFAIPMQYIGLAIGPALAAYQLGAHNDYPAAMIAAGIFAALTPLAIFPILIARRESGVLA